jgi:hypothetical protein
LLEEMPDGESVDMEVLGELPDGVGVLDRQLM